jgi:hypothetical protein
VDAPGGNGIDGSVFHRKARRAAVAPEVTEQGRRPDSKFGVVELAT